MNIASPKLPDTEMEIVKVAAPTHNFCESILLLCTFMQLQGFYYFSFVMLFLFLFKFPSAAISVLYLASARKEGKRTLLSRMQFKNFPLVFIAPFVSLCA